MSTKIKCSFCGGKGKDPYKLLSELSECVVCSGLSVVEIDVPFRKCAFCTGTGKSPLGARVYCIVCKGKGSNSIISEVICIRCIGTGRAVDGLPCTSCKGIGYK
jgi:DnaJ-class molecular chaperone